MADDHSREAAVALAVARRIAPGRRAVGNRLEFAAVTCHPAKRRFQHATCRAKLGRLLSVSITTSPSLPHAPRAIYQGKSRRVAAARAKASVSARRPAPALERVSPARPRRGSHQRPSRIVSRPPGTFDVDVCDPSYSRKPFAQVRRVGMLSFRPRPRYRRAGDNRSCPTSPPSSGPAHLVDGLEPRQATARLREACRAVPWPGLPAARFHLNSCTSSGAKRALDGGLDRTAQARRVERAKSP